MPQDLEESVTGDVELLFPDDATGKTYRLEERTVYDANEVRDQERLDDVPKYGKWLPVTVDGDEAWLNAPSSLRQKLVTQEIGTGELFTVDRLTKSGHRESDPYEAELGRPDEADQKQDRLANANQ